MEVDCTPDEARQFLGLPDVKPLQAAALERLQKQMAQAAGGFAPEALLKTWLSFVPQNPEQLRDVIAGLFRAASAARPQAADKTPASGAPTGNEPGAERPGRD